MTGVGTCRVFVDTDNDGIYETEVTTAVGKAGVQIKGYGRSDEFGQPAASTATFTLDNKDGTYTTGGTVLAQGMPCRVTHFFGATTRTRFTGRIRSLQIGWPGGGDEDSVLTITATDLLSDLARCTLRSMLEYEILADAPGFYYTLGEAQGSTSAGETSGNGGPVFKIAGSGTPLSFGNSGDASPVDSSAVTFDDGKVLQSTSGQFYPGSGGITIEAFVSTADTGGGAVIHLDDGTSSNLIEIDNSGGVLGGSVVGAGAQLGLDSFPTIINDGSVHHVALTVTSAGAMKLYVDGVQTSSVSGATMPTVALTRLRVGLDQFGNKLTGSVSHVVIYNALLSTTRIAFHAALGLGTFLETTDARLTRLAGYAGYTTTSVSPSGQQIGAQTTRGASLLAAVQEVATTEGGVLFVDGTGAITMQGRWYRATKTTADLTLTAIEIAEDSEVTWDDQQLFNQVTVTRSSGATQIVPSGTPVPLYPKDFSLNVPTDDQALDAANWVLAKHQATGPRMATVTFDLASSANAEAMLQREIGDRLSVTPMPAQLWAATGDYTIEGWDETLSSSEWTLAANLLPWQLQQAWVLGDSTYSVLGSTTVLGY